MKSTYFIFISLLFFLCSCKANQVNVKFRNDSKENFKSLNVHIFKNEFSFQNLKSKHNTNTIKVDKIYSYCFAEVITERDTCYFMPIDYVGERLYTKGKIIVKIVLLPNNQLNIKAKKRIF